MANSPAMPAPSNTGFLGHPRGLMTLFFTEMWERFSYYGMRAFLVFYVAASVDKGGLGQSEEVAFIVYGMYGSLVYLMSLPGGWIADRFLGQQKAVLFGGVVIMFGHLVLAIPSAGAFLPGLGLIILGTGLLKPNVSTIVGQLYAKDDIRRDAGFSIYYMGINLGATIAPFVCGYFAQDDDFRRHLASWGFDPNMCWHVGFGAAAVGMLAGVIQFWLGMRNLGAAGRDPTPPAPVADRKPMPSSGWIALGVGFAVTLGFAIWRLTSGGVTPKTVADAFGVGLVVVAVVVFVIMHQVLSKNAGERARVLAMVVLFFGCLSFFGLFEQAGSTLNVFADKYTERQVLGIDFPAVYWQAINGAWILLLAPVFAWMWTALARQGKEPFSVTKFAIGMVIAGAGFAILLPTIGPIDRGERTSPMYLILYYMFATMGELCISAVGLGVMNALAPKRLEGFVMGIWFLAISIGIYIAGRASTEVGKLAHKLEWGTGGLFYLIMIFAAVVAALLFAASGPIKRMLRETADPSAT